MLRALIALCTVGALSAACSSASSGTEPTKANNTAMPSELRISSCCVSGTEIPLWLAYDEGLFAKYGVNVAPLQTLPPPTGGQALLAGSIDIVNDSPSTVINAVAAGNDQMEFVGGKTSKPVYHLMSNSLTDPSQLRGKRLGVSGKYAAPAAAAYAYLKDKFGLVPDKDYTVVPSAKISDLVPVLAHNLVDVAVLSTPLYLTSQAQGSHVIADLSKSVAEANSYIITTKAFAKKYPAAVEGYLKAIIDAMAVAKSDKSKAIASIIKHQQGISQSVAETTYDEYVDLFDPNMYLDAFRPYLDYPSTAAVGKVDVKALIDDTFLRQLDTSGFLKQHNVTFTSK